MAAVLHSAPRFAPNDGVRETLSAALGEMRLSDKEENGEIVLTVQRDSIEDALRLLRDEHDYQQLMEIAGVDYPQRAERFDVVYMLLSLTKNHRVMVRVTTDEATPVPTVTTLWPVAGWLEREVFDMFGVLFAGHPDLRRILTDYGFQGHPFRKDFPLSGYVEMRYSDEAKRVVYEPVQLAQDFRSFDFMSPWEGADYVLPGDEKADAIPPAAPAPVATKPETGGPSPVVDRKYVMATGKPGDADNTSGGADPKVAPSADAPSTVAGQGQGQPVPIQTESPQPGAPEPTSSRPARKPRKGAAKPQSSPEGS
jgi:NADH-quinone oxidoreductase subunit C